MQPVKSTPKAPNLSGRVLILEESMERMEGTLKEIKGLITDGSAAQKGDRRYVWNVVMGLVTPVVAVCATVLGLYVSSLISPLKSEVHGLQAISTQNNALLSEHSKSLAVLTGNSATSISDRQALLKVQETVVERITELERHTAAMAATYDARLAEFECQVDASSQMENQRMAELHRMLAITWQIAKLGDYPLLPFPEPNISNRRGLPLGSK